MKYYTFSLKIGMTSTKVRTPETSSLEELAEALLTSVGFELDHAFGFYGNLKEPTFDGLKKEFTLFADIGEECSENDMGVEDTSVREAFQEGETLLFYFDYGDDWRFLVTCEQIETLKNKKRKPEILEVKGELPEQYPAYEEEPSDPTNIVAFSPKTNEKVMINPKPDTGEDDYEKMVKRLTVVNEKTIAAFARFLQAKNISVRTIDKHCSNINLYGNDYLINYDDDELKLSEASMRIGGFLGSWFIRKCMWSSENSIKENITSFKKFYKWLHDTGELSKVDYSQFLELIKEEKEDWLETMRRYADPNTNFEDVF